MYNSKLHVRSCAGSFSVSTVHSILFYTHTWQHMSLQHFNVLQYVSRTSTNSNSLVFFTTDHFILFVHSSRMFYYFVCSHVHVVGSCPAMLDAGRLPVCLLACCHWGHRVVPFILECAQLWATFFIILCVESAVTPSSACWRLMLGRLLWSASSVADLLALNYMCVYWYFNSLLPTQAVSN